MYCYFPHVTYIYQIYKFCTANVNAVKTVEMISQNLFNNSTRLVFLYQIWSCKPAENIQKQQIDIVMFDTYDNEVLCLKKSKYAVSIVQLFVIYIYMFINNYMV